MALDRTLPQARLGPQFPLYHDATMRIHTKTALLPLLLCWLLPAAAGQRIITDRSSPKPAAPAKPASSPAAKAATPAPKSTTNKSSKSAGKTAHRPDPLADRLLSDDEGLHVIAAALGAHIRHASGDDCSQLVHEIYQRAGFSYPYANSWDLYDGTQFFHRVWTPKPGDLVVWQGHVGIVVSPREHLFFSKLTSTGQDIASYDAPYWRGRGHPRFFRYLKPEDATQLAAARPHRKTAAREVAESRPERAPVPEKTEVAEARLPRAPKRVVVPADASEPSEPEDRGPSPTSPSRASHEADDGADSAALVPLVTPLVAASHPQPEQVRKAILKGLTEAAPVLSDAHAPALSQPLIVFDDLRVEGVHLEGDEGWAEVRIHQMGAVRSGHAELVTRTHRAFWSLRRRDDKSWEVVTPQETTYLPRKAAVRVVAHQLALAKGDADDADSGAVQKKSLAKFLNALQEP